MNVVLNLPIKGKWFDMIAYGGKREEYRDCEHRKVQRDITKFPKHLQIRQVPWLAESEVAV